MTGPEGVLEGGGASSPRLSVIMIARDAEDTVGRALESVAWADELLVLDSGSRDRTPEVAREHGARVVETDWPGYGPQKRRALEMARGDWVLSLDADEVVSPALAEEIRGALGLDPGAEDSRPRADGGDAGLPAGFEIPFRTRYLGRWLGRRGWYRERHLRLARREAARFTDARIHESMEVEGPVGRLRAPVLHYSYRDLEHHREKMREYARLKAEAKFRRGVRSSPPEAAVHGVAAFLSEYLLRGRFLDGGAGFVFSVMAGRAALDTYLRLWEMGRRGGPDRGRGPEGSEDGDRPEPADGPDGGAGGRP